MRAGDRGALHQLVECARRAESKGIYFLLSQGDHFCDPLVDQERSRLAGVGLSESTLGVAARIAEEALGPKIYFPIPMARAVDQGVSWEQATEKYHYDMIVVDEKQQWTWRGQSVAQRTKEFFLEHLSWQPEIERYYFEYRVHEHWWDKSYLEALTSPLTALRLEIVSDGDETEVRAHLRSGQSALVDLESFRLDENEQLFVRTQDLGEVCLADTERFRILREVNDTLTTVDFAGAPRPLEWP